ncbi:hypothetical protein FF100_34275 [Methylobacterium terricola]|uniref:Transposase n=1 Tax=Methylobacterium terricola TaxID=2583531 RepID=A0A5C4L5R9_9HYPH|nr:hypothetical protein [Methylobacterium terricola]TNC06652.1 hypothetical protein FF100_34275 [Methylobacterium terricola]
MRVGVSPDGSSRRHSPICCGLYRERNTVERLIDRLEQDRRPLQQARHQRPRPVTLGITTHSLT